MTAPDPEQRQVWYQLPGQETAQKKVPASEQLPERASD
jgi:hypothetical protein